MSATNEMMQTIKPLLRIAPNKVHLLVKQSTQDVLVLYENWVWMVVHQQYRFPPTVDVMVRVWGDHYAQEAPSETHYFDTLWSLRVWIEQRFQALKS